MTSNSSSLTEPFSLRDAAFQKHQVAVDAAARFEMAEGKLDGPLPDKHLDVCPLPLNLRDAGLQDLHQNFAGLITDIVRTNLQASQAMFRVTNHDEFLALQQQFISHYLQVLMQGSLQLVSAIQQATRPSSRHGL